MRAFFVQFHADCFQLECHFSGQFESAFPRSSLEVSTEIFHSRRNGSDFENVKLFVLAQHNIMYRVANKLRCMFHWFLYWTTSFGKIFHVDATHIVKALQLLGGPEDLRGDGVARGHLGKSCTAHLRRLQRVSNSSTSVSYSATVCL